jgi:UDP-glucose 4-epimerase
MSILITGGAGYIGSHMVLAALEQGEEVVVVDNLSTGVRGLVAEAAHFHLGNIGDQRLMEGVFRRYDVDAVIHFAGSLVVPESVENPLAYYENNTVASRNLIEACVRSGVKNFIFSSTAAVYGTPKSNPVTEGTQPVPASPYGRSKLMTEWMLEDASRAHDFRFIALRYFNVAGADPSGRTGQSTPKATHLIKRACQVALGRVPVLDIFGTDFPTKDGTGVRDYIHVTDLVAAHALALDHLRQDAPSAVLNCGYGHGFSVRQVVDTVANITGRKLPTRESPRRPGDVAEIVADPSTLQAQLGWKPNYNDLQKIVSTAFAWERRLNSATP